MYAWVAQPHSWSPPFSTPLKLPGLEGSSSRSTIRITGAAKNTVTKLLIEMGCACADYHHRNVRNLTVHRLQCDEIWRFVGAKKKNVAPERELEGWGDVWTWAAIDADTKLPNNFSKRAQ